MDFLMKVEAERKSRGLSEDDLERLLFILQHSARPILTALQIARVYQEYEEVSSCLALHRGLWTNEATALSMFRAGS